MPRVYVKGTLSKKECFFAYCWWTQEDQRSDTNTWWSQVRVNPAYTCSGSDPHIFKLDTYSEATDAAGVLYVGWSQSVSGNLACG